MKTITMQDLRKHGSKALPKDGGAFLVVKSKVKYAIVPIEKLEKLIDEIEDLEDALAIEQSRNSNEEWIPMEQVHKELGL